MLCPLVSLGKRRGFTMVEVLLSVLIGSSLAGSLFYVLNSGTVINDLSSVKVFARSEARRISDWVTRDLRQAQLANLALLASHTSIKFNPVFGVNVSDGTYNLTAEFIEYVYDVNAHTLTRNRLDATGGVLQSWVFTDVIEPPFFTRNKTTGNLDDLDATVLTSRNVVSVITVTKTSGKGVAVTDSLTTETKIRNE